MHNINGTLWKVWKYWHTLLESINKGAREGRDLVGQYGCIPPLQEGSKPSPQVVIHVAVSLHSSYIRAILQKNAAFLEIVLCVLPKNAIFNNRAALLGGTKQIQNLRSGDQN